MTFIHFIAIFYPQKKITVRGLWIDKRYHIFPLRRYKTYYHNCSSSNFLLSSIILLSLFCNNSISHLPCASQHSVSHSVLEVGPVQTEPYQEMTVSFPVQSVLYQQLPETSLTLLAASPPSTHKKKYKIRYLVQIYTIFKHLYNVDFLQEFTG